MLRQDEYIRELGITVYSPEAFNKHIETVARRALSSLFPTLRNVQGNNPHFLVKLNKIHVLPHLYDSTIWKHCAKKYLLLLEKVPKSFTRIFFCRVFPNQFKSLPLYRERLHLIGLKRLEYRRLLIFSLLFRYSCER